LRQENAALRQENAALRAKLVHWQIRERGRLYLVQLRNSQELSRSKCALPCVRCFRVFLSKRLQWSSVL
jgi:hypothetical protein